MLAFPKMLEERRLVRCAACDRPFWLTLRYETETTAVWRSIDCPRDGCGEPTYLLFPEAVDEVLVDVLDPRYPMARRPASPRASLLVRVGLERPSPPSSPAAPEAGDETGPLRDKA